MPTLKAASIDITAVMAKRKEIRTALPTSILDTPSQVERFTF
jgi:hypothetical protein